MLNYNAPIDGQKSTIDGDGSDQMNTFMWLKKAIITARKEQFFASGMKNYGKTSRGTYSYTLMVLP